ncbi:MAG: HYC_CC_PP family protein [Flavobacteriaceae bacterium]
MKIIKNISVSILSFIVLFSSMSFTIDEHFCGDEVIDVSYFGNAENCGMEKVSSNSSIPSLNRDHCCKDETTFFEPFLFNTEKSLSLYEIEPNTLFLHTHFHFHNTTSLKIEYFNDFSPPDIIKDIRVLHQNFLI